jgi:hypothetical protein
MTIHSLVSLSIPSLSPYSLCLSLFLSLSLSHTHTQTHTHRHTLTLTLTLTFTGSIVFLNQCFHLLFAPLEDPLSVFYIVHESKPPSLFYLENNHFPYTFPDHKDLKVADIHFPQSTFLIS